ncbi:MAG: TIGR04282 family arsenosugar biosynthesis glycosyltransferase [Acidobacteria bacterium]|nr:TIGR04282 family arsenosugar biosynthesis glycosyltransferase [Acidobacteriota bacterium]MCA1611651.1 TIGR04282 family arsenosugar biosynthesis glycosyltransferase [Acidobacteriota bacterium]
MVRLPSLVLFARVPEAGRVKTRLSPRLTDEGALRLYRAFLEDASRLYGVATEWEPVLAAEPDPDAPELARLFPSPWRRETQGGGGLGERLAGAFSREFARGAPAAIAVGSDHPALARGAVAEALRRVEQGGAAVIPAEDGGYCAIAFSAGAPWQEALRDVPWSTDAVLSVTRRRLAARGVELWMLAPGYDVDRPEDVDRLRRDLSARDSRSSDYPAATARALAELP